MSQATAAIVNMSRTLFRPAVNAALQALQSLNSGLTEPIETYPYMWWADQTSGKLKRRNAANNAWITVMDLASGLIIGTDVQAYDAATIAVAPGASGNVLTSSGTSWVSQSQSSGMPRSYLAGLGLSNNVLNATNDIDITAGACRDSTNAADINLSTALTKRLDAAWAVGTNQGGLDTGAIANTTYHVWLIKRSDTSVVDVLFSTSATTPTMPANYDYKRRIGSIVRTSGAIKTFVQDGDYFRWLATVLDVNDASPGTSATSRALSVPSGINVHAFGSVQMSGSTGTPICVLSDLAANDEAASMTTSPLGFGSFNSAIGYVGSFWQVRTNTSAQIRSRVNEQGGAVTLKIATYGWFDSRGRNV